ncbi:putative transcriptional regulator with C-terminal CBS domains [Thermus oshimai JL-2]|uniref:Putative transcriptional regulator with C-terminal CBS domains n=1 Tax=Thermus oshimai JL-2 TaxID=751945 RepID=K7QV86_THEOS|nr:helix-turn-helix transcriptional regulator [Thermus oshimai]AFV76341.1 putative transcriptional regulator with C-terminal CBS domains [Thermus oshimai JL-2]
MATTERTGVGEVLRQRRRELGLTLGQVARTVGTSDAYIWKLEQGLINLENVALPRLMGLLKALRWTPEEFALATGVHLPGLVGEEPKLGIPLIKVPTWPEGEEHIVLGLPNLSLDPKDLWAHKGPQGWFVFRKGEEPEHGGLAVATGPQTLALRYLGLNPKRSYVAQTLDCPPQTLTLEKDTWELHKVVLNIALTG